MGDLYDTFSSAISGAGAGVLPNDPLNDGNDTDINVYFREGESYKKSDIAAIPLRSADGTVRVSDVAEIRDDLGPITMAAPQQHHPGCDGGAQ